jgi:signal transduction histidine kinase
LTSCITPAAGSGQDETADSVAAKLSNLDRRFAVLIRYIPYVLLLLSYVLSLLAGGMSRGDAFRVTLVVVVTAAWTYFLHTRLGALTPDIPAEDRAVQWRVRIYFAGMLALGALLMAMHPLFFIYVITGFFHANLLSPRWLMVAGVAATSLLVNALIIGYPDLGPGNLMLYAIIFVVQTVTISGGIIGAEWLRRLSEQRRLAVADLEAALEENAGLHAQLVSQAREAGVLDERQRLAGEIHDTVAQGLAGVITNIEAARNDPDIAERERHLEGALQLARESLDETRRSVNALRPTPLERSRLADAIAEVTSRWEATSGVNVDLGTTGTERWLHPEVEVTLLRVTQEALANVGKHSSASRVGITLSYMGELVTVDVRDDGVGFTPAAVSGRPGDSYGLEVMRQRVERLGGMLDIESEPGIGTAISARIPVGAGER